MEVYGESPSRPLFSAEFDLAPQRAAMLALSELRLRGRYRAADPGRDAAQAGRQSGAKRSFAQCAAVCDGPVRGLSPAGAGGQCAAAGVPTLQLPGGVRPDHGAGRPPSPGGRLHGGYASWSEKQYLKQINAEIARLEPLHRRADSLDKETARARARAQLLDQFRKQTRMDLDALNELTHLLEPPAWSNTSLWRATRCASRARRRRPRRC